MPTINGNGKEGQVWISDAECRLRYAELSSECPREVYWRIGTLHNRELPRSEQWGFSAPGEEHCRKCRVERMSKNAMRAIEEGLQMIDRFQKTRATQSSDNSIVEDEAALIEDLRTKVIEVEEIEDKGNWNTQSWQHVVAVCKIVNIDPQAIQARVPEWTWDRMR